MDDTLNWLLLDCTVVAVQDTEDVAEEVAMTTLFASIKASWKLYKHFFFAAFFFSLLSKAMDASLLGGGGRASGLVSESAGPNISLPSEKNRKIRVSKTAYSETLQGRLRTEHGAATESGLLWDDAGEPVFTLRGKIY